MVSHLDEIRNVEPTPPRELNSSIPRDLETICLKAISKQAGERFATCAAMAKDLLRWENNEPIQARRISTVERLLRWSRRNSTVAVLSLFSVSTLMVGTVVSAFFALHAQSSASRAVAHRRQAVERLEAQKRAKSEAANAVNLISQTHREAEKDLYLSRITLAGDRFAKRDLFQMEELIKNCPEELHGWEWNWLDLVAQNTFPRVLHEHALSAAFSSSGDLVASSGFEEVKIWKSHSGELFRTIPEERATFLEFAGDKKLLTLGDRRAAVATDRRTLRCWDLDSSEQMWHVDDVSCAKVTPDGLRVVVGTKSGDVLLIDASSAKRILQMQGHVGSITDLDLSQNNSIASASTDQTARVWDASTGSQKAIMRHSAAVAAVCFGRGCQRITTCCANQKVSIWNLEFGQEVASFHFEDATELKAALARQGNEVVIFGRMKSNDGFLKSIDVNDGREISTIKSHFGFRALRNSDGAFLAYTRQQWPRGALLVYDVMSGKLVSTIAAEWGTTCFALNHDGERIAVGIRNDTVCVWSSRVSTAMPPLDQSRRIETAIFTPDDDVVIAEADGRRCWLIDRRTHETKLELQTPEHRVQHLAVSADGQWVAGGARSASIWHISDGRIVQHLAGTTSRITCLVFDHSSSRVITAHQDSTARVWDTNTGKTLHVLRGHSQEIKCVSISPDGQQIITGSSDGTVKIWSLASGEILSALEGKNLQVNAVRISPDNRKIFAAGDRRIDVWDAVHGRELPAIDVEAQNVDAIVISPDASRIFGLDGRHLMVWGTEKRRLLLKIGLTGNELDINQDGSTLLTTHVNAMTLSAQEGFRRILKPVSQDAGPDAK